MFQSFRVRSESFAGRNQRGFEKKDSPLSNHFSRLDQPQIPKHHVLGFEEFSFLKSAGVYW